MREGLGRDVAARTHLHPIVVELGRRSEALFQVARIKHSARVAYFEGLVNGVAAATTGKGSSARQTHFPRDKSGSLSRNSFGKNPERWKGEPRILVAAALASAFPCADLKRP